MGRRECRGTGSEIARTRRHMRTVLYWMALLGGALAGCDGGGDGVAPEDPRGRERRGAGDAGHGRDSDSDSGREDQACDEGDERCQSVHEIESEFGILLARSELLARDVANDEAQSEEAASYLARAIPEASDDPEQTRSFIVTFQRRQSVTNPNVRVTGEIDGPTLDAMRGEFGDRPGRRGEAERRVVQPREPLRPEIEPSEREGEPRVEPPRSEAERFEREGEPRVEPPRPEVEPSERAPSRTELPRVDPERMRPIEPAAPAPDVPERSLAAPR